MSRGNPRTRPPAGHSGPLSPAQARRYRSQQVHHRRRRRILAAAVAGVAILILLIAGSGGGAGAGGRRGPTLAPAGFFSRIGTLAGSGPGSFTAAEHTAENAAIDRTLAITPYVRAAGTQHREVALTFDDGPGPYTPQILSVLEHTATPATFFEVGVLEQYFHVSTSRMVADGYPIGDHTQTHAPMGKLGAAAQEAQILHQVSALGAYGAPFPRMFRPPYGLFDSTTLTLLRKLRMLMVLWTIDTNDYRQPGISAIVNSILSGARPGAIVLMHDAGGTRSETVAALPLVIAGLRARGYKLVTVPRLLLDNPPGADQQITSLAGSGG